MSLKEELRLEMIETCDAYHALLAEVPDEAFPQPSDNPAWTIGEVLFHMSLAPRFLTADLRMILGNHLLAKIFGALVPASLFNRLNEVYTRYGGRSQNRLSLARRYDRAHQQALQALDKLQEEDLKKSLEYPGYDPLLSGEVTVERLFRYIKLHFEIHARQIREKMG